MNFNGLPIIVFGDILLDCHITGKIERISPEAPVPVLSAPVTSYSLGGAANVAQNIKSLGSDVYLIGRFGKDSAGVKLKELTEDSKINTRFCYETDEAPTSLKTRYLGRGQQLLRVDYESQIHLSSITVLSILEEIDKSGIEISTLVLSDYNKGVLNEKTIPLITSWAKAKNIFILGDPKKIDYALFLGCDLITPNQKEAEKALNFSIDDDSSLEKALCSFRDDFKMTFPLITMGERGIAFLDNNKVDVYSALAKDVFDVTGAGDTVIASLAHRINRGDDVAQAIRFANAAASIVVGKIGCAYTDEASVYNVLKSEMKSIFNTSEVSELQSLVGRRSIVFTNGCFDLLHFGHVSYLKDASKLGEFFVLGLNSDKSIKRLKGNHRPVMPENDRANILASLEFIDAVVIFEDDTPLNLIKCLKPDVLVKGGDYNIKDIVGKEYAKKTVTIPFIHGYSTTEIIKKIKNEFR